MDFSQLYGTVSEWFLGLGGRYGVNPYVFGAIYVGAIPFFTLSMGWLVRSLRAKRPVLLPMLSAGFFFVSAYLYLIVAGRNVPAWVYAFIAVLVIGGAVGAVRKVREQVDAPDAPAASGEEASR